MIYKVDKDIPLPESKKKYDKYPYKKMEIGDSFFLAGSRKRNKSDFGGYLRLFEKESGRKFTARIVTENGITGIRLWRIK